MLRSDTRVERTMSTNIDDNINSITIDVVCEIEKELLHNPYDMTSLVFLLYDVPDTALQRLLVYQRVDKYSTTLNLLHEWAQVAKLKPTWKHEFLEALLICQLYGIVKKLGFNVQNMKKQYQPDDIYHNMYVNPTKKALYKLCENMNSNNLNTLKKTLKEFKIDTSEYETCELVFLKLMSEKIITMTESQTDKKFNFDKLVKLIQKLPGLEAFAKELRMMQDRCNETIEPIDQPVATSSPSADPTSDVSIPQPNNKQTNSPEDFTDIYDMLKELDETDLDDNHLKSDSNKLVKNMYPIKDPKKIGVCLIINQEDFHLCDQSIEDINLKASLTKRKGSAFDKIVLKKTMSSMNFEVITRDNLNHTEMIDCIKRIIREKVTDTTSVFMLCIMSHGVRGHVFAADSVKVKVEDIQNLLDSDDAIKLQGIPKVLVIQACQVDDVPETRLVADSPNPNIFKLRKLDFLVYWATSPEYEAFRVEEAGSIFIQLLCLTIQRRGKHEHLNDIFTRVNNYVIKCCTKFRCFQVPLFKNSLRKNLYLHIPESSGQ